MKNNIYVCAFYHIILNSHSEIKCAEYAGDYHKMMKIVFMVSVTHSINSENLP